MLQFLIDFLYLISYNNKNKEGNLVLTINSKRVTNGGRVAII